MGVSLVQKEQLLHHSNFTTWRTPISKGHKPLTRLTQDAFVTVYLTSPGIILLMLFRFKEQQLKQTEQNKKIICTKMVKLVPENCRAAFGEL